MMIFTISLSFLSFPGGVLSRWYHGICCLGTPLPSHVWPEPMKIGNLQTLSVLQKMGMNLFCMSVCPSVHPFICLSVCFTNIYSFVLDQEGEKLQNWYTFFVFFFLLY